MSDAIAKGHLRRPTAEEPLRIVDLGCGNAYLTLTAQRFLESRGLAVRLTGVDVKEQSREHSSAVAAELGLDAEFVVGTISAAELAVEPEVVLALHACDTATDEALARAVGWGASLVLAAPCCHHDVAAQLRRTPTPAPYAMLTRHGILRERFADTLTDALRASLMRLSGYRVDVMQFVESKHTPRNTLLRAVRTGGPVKGGGVRNEYDDLVAAWGVPAPPSVLAPTAAPGRMSRLERVLACAIVVPFVIGFSVAGAESPSAEEVCRFQDPQIVESSGLVARDGLFLTVNDSGDSGRVFVVDGQTCLTVGSTTWSDDVEDVEAIAPADDGVLVGDIGDNLAARESVRLLQVPAGRGEQTVTPTTYEITYPGGARDAEALLVQPETGQVLHRLQGADGRDAVRRPRAALRVGPQPGAPGRRRARPGHRRRVLPGRSALRAAHLLTRGRLHLPGLRVGRRHHPPGAGAGRGDRGRRAGAGLRELGGPTGAGAADRPAAADRARDGAARVRAELART